MSTKNTAKTTKIAAKPETTVAEPTVATPATVVKAHAQWNNVASTRRQYGYNGSTTVTVGSANNAKPGTARHTAIAAMQAVAAQGGTMQAVYAVAATNWVHWAIAQGYIVPAKG